MFQNIFLPPTITHYREHITLFIAEVIDILYVKQVLTYFIYAVSFYIEFVKTFWEL